LGIEASNQKRTRTNTKRFVANTWSVKKRNKASVKDREEDDEEGEDNDGGEL
jgi:hypothetical protein